LRPCETQPKPPPNGSRSLTDASAGFVEDWLSDGAFERPERGRCGGSKRRNNADRLAAYKP